jgi:hypothetical protein
MLEAVAREILPPPLAAQEVWAVAATAEVYRLPTVLPVCPIPVEVVEVAAETLPPEPSVTAATAAPALSLFAIVDEVLL